MMLLPEEKPLISLNDLVVSLEKKVGDTEKRFEEINELSEERLKQALEAETKIIQLKSAMQSLQEKVSDMASENQIRRHQSFSSELKPSMENGLHGTEEPQTPASNLVTGSDSKPKKPPVDHQHENNKFGANCDSFLITKGHGSTDFECEVVATVSGVIECVNKLVYVRNLSDRFKPEVGDILVGRVSVTSHNWTCYFCCSKAMEDGDQI